MSIFHFGMGDGHLPLRATQKIALRHGAQLVNLLEPDGRKRHWFNTANLGSPHDERVAKAVMDDLRAAGIIKSKNR